MGPTAHRHVRERESTVDHHETFLSLHDLTWAQLLKNLSHKDLASLRQTSWASRSAVGRALEELHLVGPDVTFLDNICSGWNSLRELSITLLTAQPDGATCMPEPPRSLPFLRTLHLTGWLGKDGTRQMKRSQGRPVDTPHVPAWLLAWAARCERLTEVHVARCWLDTKQLQMLVHVRELHLVDVALPGVASTDMEGSAALSPLVAALDCLPALDTLVLQQQDSRLYQPLSPLRGLCRLRSLRHVQLRAGRAVVMDIAAQVPHWAPGQLLTLCLASVYPDVDVNDVLRAMAPGTPSLRTLDLTLGQAALHNWHITQVGSLFPGLTSLTLPLEELAVSSWWPAPHPAGGDEEHAVAAAPLQPLLHRMHGAPSLTALHLPWVPLTRPALAMVCAAPGLRELDVSGCRHVDDGVMFRLACAPHLIWLSVSGCVGITDIGLAQLATSAPNLAHLDVSGCEHVSDLGISRLRTLRHLAHLDCLGCTRITDEGVQGLLAGVSSHPLKVLNLGHGPQLTDWGLWHLSQRAPALERLTLDGAPSTVTPTGVGYLKGLSRLKALSVAWCSPAVKAAAVEVAVGVLGCRLGPLCCVPPGSLQTAPPQPPPAPYPPPPRPASTGQRTPGAPAQGAPGGGTCGHAPTAHSPPHPSGALPAPCPACDSTPHDGAASPVASGSGGGGPGSSGLSASLASTGSLLSLAPSLSPSASCCTFVPSASCVGFAPLGDKAPVLGDPGWWLTPQDSTDT